MSDLFVGLTTEEQCNRIKELFGKRPELKTYFGETFCGALIYPGQNVEDVHPLFWQLQDDLVSESFTDSLRTLSSHSGFYKFVREELVGAPNHSKAISAIREMQTYHFYKTIKGLDVVWKPTVNGVGNKNPDLQINASIPIYLEIFTITDSDEELASQWAQNRLHAAINKIKNNPFYVSLSQEVLLKEQHVQGIIAFTQELIENAKSGGVSELEGVYEEGGMRILSVTLYATDKRGQWASASGPVKYINNSGRIKSRILTKIQGFQLPPKDTSRHLNGYLIFLEPFLYDNDDMVAAVKGQHTVTFDIVHPELGGQAGHASNGVIHHADWDQDIASSLDFIASTKASSPGFLKKLNSFVFCSEDAGITPDDLKSLLFED